MPASIRPSKQQQRRSESPPPHKKSSDATTSTTASESSSNKEGHSFQRRSLADRARVFDKSYIASPHSIKRKEDNLQQLLDESNHRKESMVIHGRRKTYRDADNRGLDGEIVADRIKDAADLNARLDASDHRKKANVHDGVKQVHRPREISKTKNFSIIPKGSAKPQAKPMGAKMKALLEASEHKKLLATSSTHRLANRMMQGSHHSRGRLAITFNLRQVKNRIKPALPEGTVPLKPTETTFQNVHAPKLKVDIKTFEAPKFVKTAQQKDLLRDVMANQTYVLKRHTGSTAETLLNAMEPVEMRKGQILQRQGENRAEDDNMYVVEEGHVDVKINGKLVERIHAGGVFGQERLLLRKENEATISAGSAVTKLFKLGQTTFRAVLQKQYQSVMEELKSKTRLSTASSTWNDNIYNNYETIMTRGGGPQPRHQQETSDDEASVVSQDASTDDDDDLASFQEEEIVKPVHKQTTSSSALVSKPSVAASTASGKKATPSLSTKATKKKSKKSPGIFNFEDSPIFQQQERLRKSTQKYAASKDDLEFIKVLGEGQFGEVWLVAATLPDHDPSRHEFALKIQKLGGEDDDDEDGFSADESKDAIRNEIKALKELHHPFLVNLVHTYESADSMDMLLGLIPGGELWEQVHKEDADGNWKSGIPEGEARFYAYVVADTLGFLHSRGYIFRDLKPENIMLDADGYPIIVDFGFAKKLLPGGKTFTFCGTPNYVAPEIISNAGHSKEVDYWALGVVIYEMVSGENPFFFDGMEQSALYQAITEEDPYEMSADVSASDQVRELTDLLFLKDPEERLGCQGVHEILEHAWFIGMPPMCDIHAKRVDPKKCSELIFEEYASDADDDSFADVEEDNLNDVQPPLRDLRFDLPDDLVRKSKTKSVRAKSLEDHVPPKIEPPDTNRRFSDHDVTLYDADELEKEDTPTESPTPKEYNPSSPKTIKYWTPRKKGLGYYAKMKSAEEVKTSKTRRSAVNDFLSQYLENVDLDDAGDEFLTPKPTKKGINAKLNASCPGLHFKK